MSNPPTKKLRVLELVSNIRLVRPVRMIPEYSDHHERSMNFRYYR